MTKQIQHDKANSVWVNKSIHRHPEFKESAKLNRGISRMKGDSTKSSASVSQIKKNVKPLVSHFSLQLIQKNSKKQLHTLATLKL